MASIEFPPSRLFAMCESMFRSALRSVVGAIVRTLKRRISGWTRERGWPLTLTRPLPCCKESQYAAFRERV